MGRLALRALRRKDGRVRTGGHFVTLMAAALPPPPGFPDFGQKKRVFPVRTPLPGYPLDRIKAESCLYPLQLTPYGQESGPFLSEAWRDDRKGHFWALLQIGERGDLAWSGAKGRSGRAMTAWGRRGADQHGAQWRRRHSAPRGDLQQ